MKRPPSTCQEFWQAKFAANVAKEAVLRGKLLEDVWRMATVWKCAVRKTEQVEALTESLSIWLRTEELQIEIGDNDARRS